VEHHLKTKSSLPLVHGPIRQVLGDPPPSKGVRDLRFEETNFHPSWLSTLGGGIILLTEITQQENLGSL
jgi:hypothetical protein